MGGRGFCVKIELDLQAITCPGVWLCPNGKIVLRIDVLNSKIESRSLAPAFPLLYHDKFKFEKVFTGISTLAELQNSLEDEYLYTELVQWSLPKGTPMVLATFETNLADLLYPAPCFKGLLAGSEVDLLMEPTKYFPGILAPKIEISTRTIIEEVIGILESTISRAHGINPKTIHSKNGTCVHRKRSSKGIIRQRKVCHTQGKTKSQPNRSMGQRHASIEGTSSSPSSATNRCSHLQIDHNYKKSQENCNSARLSTISRPPEISPFCKNSHMFENCPVCSKYKCYFSHDREEQTKLLNSSDDNNHENFQKIYNTPKYSHHSYTERENESEKWRPKSAPYEASVHNFSSSSALRAKTKELQRHDAKSNYVAGDTRVVNYFDSERDQDRQGFYKNLEKFYKRMYKQAKIRAQEVDCT